MSGSASTRGAGSDPQEAGARRRIVELEARVALLEAERDHLAAELAALHRPWYRLARRIYHFLRCAWKN